MKKSQQLRWLSNRIKEVGELDKVTAVSSKTQYKKINIAHDPQIVYFVMTYAMDNGKDTKHLARISWNVINNVKWNSENLEEDLMVQLIVKTCGEQLIGGLKAEMSNMARNAMMRARGDISLLIDVIKGD